VERRLILSSSSPRRQELLRSMGIQFTAFSPDVDENISGEPDSAVRLIARRKAEAAALLYPEDMVLAADTLVYAAGQILGKPLDMGDAARMLRLLSGTWHKVYTGVCLIAGGVEQVRAAMTEVLFSPMTEEDILDYCRSGEPFGKAGAYAVQGLGGMYIEEIRGSYTNVVGLPTSLVRSMLRAASQPFRRQE
jgi:septum formation protein